MTRKFCPIKAANSSHAADGPHCNGEKCAWWMKKEGCCAIVDIAMSLDMLSRGVKE